VVQVGNIHDAPGDAVDSSNYRLVSFRLLRVLKGKQRAPLENVMAPLNVHVEGVEMRNPAMALFTPGRQLILFPARNSSVDYPCEAVAATPSALRVLQDALGNQFIPQSRSDARD
jgi:hypothetical protein